ncbi:MAG TPA: leucine-rich repeat-containing protein kinase family protein [Leptospiraceae bacterium]|nr:leucine-rich repeat-containing protein kinase family protein [Leptospiraceae bacterium]HMW04501.1 leucine-rich repeat-containing protein kinase family protein [Leptospiraceae bacterium]HMX31159.1 leucine-rich repeat-containing protein kinase family protein [Leptospiraceae bacterium]HMY30687.1 leucine-rich repeat-containing protein kinase family protein [Leptospiraceae bacterium]HMZ63244.1 leucine-rich repeat-containing protein kinase family protein [Leptospiraceae bacterium]
MNLKEFKLSDNLKSIPNELYQLAATLEILDLSGNQLSSLPDDFNKFQNLKILFLSDNQFEKFPKVLAQCKNLDIIGFKNNQISQIEENSFPEKLRWLILTNNKLTQIPKSIGNCSILQKLMLSGNQIYTIPSEISNCQNLELIRLAANQLIQIPEPLMSISRLSWIAIAANPCLPPITPNKSFKEKSWSDIEILEKLGSGASGDIFKARLRNSSEMIAVKVFKGEITSDGYPIDEMNICLSTGEHPNIVKVIGKINQHPDRREGILLELIPDSFSKVGDPPNFQTCTRDSFKNGLIYSEEEILHILLDISNALNHLHSLQILHGDLYAHNMMFNRNQLRTYIGDFGAATSFSNHSKAFEKFAKLEIRAFGCLVDDLLNLRIAVNSDKPFIQKLERLRNQCLDSNPYNRPNFLEIQKYLISRK